MENYKWDLESEGVQVKLFSPLETGEEEYEYSGGGEFEDEEYDTNEKDNEKEEEYEEDEKGQKREEKDLEEDLEMSFAKK